jgi:hypothetical protein|tara:strand:- start:2986 stop:3120 length:135 start_codon:yes stop_codon:yes gene_type:complete
MPKLVLRGKYSAEAWQGLADEGATGREKVVSELFAFTGAELEAY